MDLFTPLVPDARFHPNFSHALRNAASEDRDVLNAWADGFLDRDGKFVIEFQTTFNSSFWELYLFAVLRELGCSIDLAFSRPDFLARKATTDFAVEATIASNAVDKPGEWTGDTKAFMELEDRAPLVREATVRLTNSVVSKHRKHQSTYSGLPEVAGKPFVIAVAPFEQPFGRVQNTEAIFQSLFGFTATPYEVVGESDEGNPIVTGGEFIKRASVSKSAEVEVPLGLFSDNRLADVSAVVFSSVATWGKVRALSKDPNPNIYFETLRANMHGPLPIHDTTPKSEYVEHLLDGLCVYHNPYATRPIPWELFRGPMVTQVTWIPGEPEPRVESWHGVLLQRTVISVVPRVSA